MNSDLITYPDTGSSNKDRDKEHAVCGRSFELFMLCFTINRCDCCGSVQPNHIDPDVKKMLHFHLIVKHSFHQ